jgi:hypothetical protein
MDKPMAHVSPSRRASPNATDLDAMIAETEDARDFYCGFLERAAAAGLGLRRGQTLLRRAEERIVQLCREREVIEAEGT